MSSACISRMIRPALLAVGMISVGFVGVDDPCPWPNPYPPADAGWAEVYNPGFEEGFTNGVADEWTSFKDAGLAGNVHVIGTDQVYTGSRSQKLVLPQPSEDWQEAGVYQRVYVVPGADYTVTARVRIHFPAQGGTCQGVRAWMGVNPFGIDDPNGSGTGWVQVCSEDQWVLTTITVKAGLPVMTVCLKGTRTWPLYGDGALVWFDEVTIDGPVPTEPPPGQEPDPIDPESLIPPTIGGNLVTNSSFEEAYTGGVSANWAKWSTVGVGEWKRSQRVGKVGGAKYDCGGNQENVDMRPKTALLISGNPETDPGVPGTLGSSDFYKTFDFMQDTIIVGRPMVDGNYGDYYNNPTYWGARLAEHCKNYEQDFPRIDCWQGWNEPDISGQWQKVLDFSLAFTQRAHELGLKTVVLNLATGNPGNMWQMVNESYAPHCGDLLAEADYLGHHVYGWAPDELMVTKQEVVDVCSFAMRPRRFKDMYDRRGWRFPPVIATEGSTSAPWHGKYTPDQVYTDLVVMGDYMNANTWWCGYTNFVVGALCSWAEFDLVDQFLAGGQEMTAAIGDWNYDHPADAMGGVYSQMFGAGEVHPKTLAELTPAGYFNGGVNQQVTGLIPGEVYLLDCWMKYEFRGHQPDMLAFYLGVDPTGQTADGSAATIDWGIDQITDKAPTHEIFTHIWRTFTASSPSASIWLRAHHSINDPSFKCYVDLVAVTQVDDAPAGPTIDVQPVQIDRTILVGQTFADDTFTIDNVGTGTITYSLSESCDWLSLSPHAGSSSGETDPITVEYDVAGLVPGEYFCQVEASAPEAVNSPLTAPMIHLTVTAASSDFDQDGDVDMDDFAHLQTCLTGPGVPQDDPVCQDCLLDEDEDVDQNDLGIFLTCISGANLPPAAGCQE